MLNLRSLTNQNAAVESAYPGLKQVVTEQTVARSTTSGTQAADDRLPCAEEGAACMAIAELEGAGVSNMINFSAMKTGAVLSVTTRSEGETKATTSDVLNAVSSGMQIDDHRSPW